MQGERRCEGRGRSAVPKGNKDASSAYDLYKCSDEFPFMIQCESMPNETACLDTEEMARVGRDVIPWDKVMQAVVRATSLDYE